ncbi:hypothetical protein YC2023_002292 [Brassica napus]
MDVTWDNINFRLSYSPLSRRFNDSTPFTELTETVNPMVPEQLSCSASAIWSTFVDDTCGAQCIMTTLRIGTFTQLTKQRPAISQRHIWNSYLLWLKRQLQGSCTMKSKPITAFVIFPAQNVQKKLQPEVSSFSCIACDDSNAVDVVRYRLELSVSDQTDEAVSHQTDEAVFVTFDTEILNRQTFELLKLHILWSAH